MFDVQRDCTHLKALEASQPWQHGVCEFQFYVQTFCVVFRVRLHHVSEITRLGLHSHPRLFHLPFHRHPQLCALVRILVWLLGTWPCGMAAGCAPFLS